MWIGILVLITFSLCAVACLVISIRGAMRRQWHVFVALLIPALAIGGTIFDMVAKPLSYEIFGNPHLEDVPEGAKPLTDDDLIANYNGMSVFGLEYLEDTEEFVTFDETYNDQGGFKGRNSNGSKWSGGWDPIENQLCTTLGQETACYDVFQDGDFFYEANHRNEIVNRYRAVPYAMESPKEAVALSEATLGIVVPGHTLSGELQQYMDEPYFSASFAADSDVVTVARSNEAGGSGSEETGTYRIELVEEIGKLCLAGVMYIPDECFTLVPSANGFDLVREKGRVVAIVTTLE